MTVSMFYFVLLVFHDFVVTPGKCVHLGLEVKNLQYAGREHDSYPAPQSGAAYAFPIASSTMMSPHVPQLGTQEMSITRTTRSA
jgi:hypothetical protein